MSGDDSPILKDRSPLRLLRTYDKGLLPTPKIKPIRKVEWIYHPILEIENVLTIARKERCFSLLNESQNCEYSPGIFYKYKTGIYGDKIANIEMHAIESQKKNLQDDYSPRTKEIYSVIEDYLFRSVQEIINKSNEKTNPKKSKPRKFSR